MVRRVASLLSVACSVCRSHTSPAPAHALAQLWPGAPSIHPWSGEDGEDGKDGGEGGGEGGGGEGVGEGGSGEGGGGGGGWVAAAPAVTLRRRSTALIVEKSMTISKRQTATGCFIDFSPVAVCRFEMQATCQVPALGEGVSYSSYLEEELLAGNAARVYDGRVPRAQAEVHSACPHAGEDDA